MGTEPQALPHFGDSPEGKRRQALLATLSSMLEPLREATGQVQKDFEIVPDVLPPLLTASYALGRAVQNLAAFGEPPLVPGA